MATLIIAEAGVNHNGDIHLAKQLIDIAIEAGVDVIKFQTFNTSSLVSSHAKKAEYQLRNSSKSQSQFDMLKQLELSEEAHLELINYCKDKNIRFLSTAFDLQSIDMLARLGIKLFKIPSGEITNLPYLRKIATLAEEVIISTGMCTMDEIRDTLNVLKQNGLSHDKITLLHCNTEYPTPMEDVNLSAMVTMKNEFNLNVGYSDHTLGIEVPIAAVALGATIIEKHITLDRNLPGPDHAASIEPNELMQLVKSIRNIELALGSGEKKPSNSEIKNMQITRKSIHLAKAIYEGEIFQVDHLIMLRPGDGISPMLIDNVVGARATRNLIIGAKLKKEDFNREA